MLNSTVHKTKTSFLITKTLSTKRAPTMLGSARSLQILTRITMARTNIRQLNYSSRTGSSLLVQYQSTRTFRQEKFREHNQSASIPIPCQWWQNRIFSHQKVQSMTLSGCSHNTTIASIQQEISNRQTSLWQNIYSQIKVQVLSEIKRHLIES